jgi:hypothetical protein
VYDAYIDLRGLDRFSVPPGDDWVAECPRHPDGHTLRVCACALAKAQSSLEGDVSDELWNVTKVHDPEHKISAIGVPNHANPCSPTSDLSEDLPRKSNCAQDDR